MGFIIVEMRKEAKQSRKRKRKWMRMRIIFYRSQFHHSTPQILIRWFRVKLWYKRSKGGCCSVSEIRKNKEAVI